MLAFSEGAKAYLAEVGVVWKDGVDRQTRHQRERRRVGPGEEDPAHLKGIGARIADEFNDDRVLFRPHKASGHINVRCCGRWPDYRDKRIGAIFLQHELPDGPDLGGTVLSGRSQECTVRTVGNRVHEIRVRLQPLDRARSRYFPDVDRFIVTARGDCPSVGTEHHTGDLVRVPLENRQTDGRGDIPDDDRGITAGRCQSGTVRTEGNPAHRTAVTRQYPILLTGLHVPEPYAGVVAGRGKCLAVRTERDTHNTTAVSEQRSLLLPRSGVPQTDRPVVTGRSQQLPIGTERN